MGRIRIMQENGVYSKFNIFTLSGLVFGMSLFATEVHADNPHGHAAAQTPDAAMAGPTEPDTRVLDLASLSDMQALVAKLADKRVVFVGETHNRYDHHLNQLTIIQGMYAQSPELAIGLEFFQRPFQHVLDRYVAGEIGERELLAESEYFERWRFDYRLYRPILRFAREKGIPLIALNVPRELTSRIASMGIKGLDEADRAMLPAKMERDDPAYRSRIEQVFNSHPGSTERNFEHFFEAQLLWDEGMAEQAARYLQAHPHQRMVVLAGSGHLVYGQGIPKRLLRREPMSAAIVINSAHHSLDPDLADYLLFPHQVKLPKSGLMGVFLDTENKGVSIKGFADDSPAKQVGLKKGDRILRLAGTLVQTYSDVRLALMDRVAGEEVPVDVLREHMILGDEQLSYSIKLY